ncbi:hypothetical protein LCGC14_1572460 [marine sediment metagenome]|uniref:Uncharacterized protein n=1 Tax=marine sediment metagenome TaxID=412755 RepID=A0A0F9IJF4_9ZZZZ
MDTENQTETNERETPAAEVSPGETELDTLLNEFDTADSISKSDLQNVVKAIQPVAESIAPVVKYVNDEREKRATDAFNKDIEEAVAFLIEPEDLKEIPAEFAQGYLEVHATKHPEFNTAFEGKEKNPSEWQTQLAKARDEFAELAKGIPGAPEMSVDYWVKAIQGGIADISNIPSDIRSQVVEQIFAPREYPENELQIMIRNMRAGTATQPELDYQGALDAIAMDETILNKDMANYLTALEYGEIEPETTFEAFTGTEKPKKTAAELEREAREAGKLGYISPEGEFISLPESISPLVE